MFRNHRNKDDVDLLVNLLGLTSRELYVFDHVRVPGGEIGTIIRGYTDRHGAVMATIRMAHGGEENDYPVNALTLYQEGSGRP